MANKPRKRINVLSIIDEPKPVSRQRLEKLQQAKKGYEEMPQAEKREIIKPTIYNPFGQEYDPNKPVLQETEVYKAPSFEQSKIEEARDKLANSGTRLQFLQSLQNLGNPVAILKELEPETIKEKTGNLAKTINHLKGLTSSNPVEFVAALKDEPLYQQWEEVITNADKTPFTLQRLKEINAIASTVFTPIMKVFEIGENTPIIGEQAVDLVMRNFNLAGLVTSSITPLINPYTNEEDNKIFQEQLNSLIPIIVLGFEGRLKKKGLDKKPINSPEVKKELETYKKEVTENYIPQKFQLTEGQKGQPIKTETGLILDESGKPKIEQVTSKTEGRYEVDEQGNVIPVQERQPGEFPFMGPVEPLPKPGSLEGTKGETMIMPEYQIKLPEIKSPPEPQKLLPKNTQAKQIVLDKIKNKVEELSQELIDANNEGKPVKPIYDKLKQYESEQKSLEAEIKEVTEKPEVKTEIKEEVKQPVKTEPVKETSTKETETSGVLETPVQEKSIKQLEQENKYTAPKIPSEKVFSNSVEVPKKELTDKVNKYIDSGTISELPKEKISIDNIVPTQKNLTIDNLKKTQDVIDSKEDIVFLKDNGKYYILDGHHRIANDILKGKKEIEGYYYETKQEVKQPYEMTKSEYEYSGENKEPANKIKFNRGNREWEELVLNSDENGYWVNLFNKDIYIPKEEATLIKGRKTLRNEHKQLVEQALSEGKTVPESVLKDYPELRKEGKGEVEKPPPRRIKQEETPIRRIEKEKTSLKQQKDDLLNQIEDIKNTITDDNIQKTYRELKEKGYKVELTETRPYDPIKGSYGSYYNIEIGTKGTGKYKINLNKGSLDYFKKKIEKELPISEKEAQLKIEQDRYRERVNILKDKIKNPEQLYNRKRKSKLELQQEKDFYSEEVKNIGKEITKERKRVITNEQYQQAKKNIGKLPDNISSNPIDFYAKKVKDLTIIGSYHLENGLRDFGKWSKKMIEDVGEWVRPKLEELYEKAIQIKLKDTKVVGDDGKPLRVYSGHSNTTMYGKFNRRKATSGAFYSSESPDISSGYAMSKIGSKEGYLNGEQYRIKGKNGEYNKKLWQYEFSEEQKKKLQELKNRKDENGEYVYDLHNMENYIESNKNYDKDVRRWSVTDGINKLQNIWEYNEQMGNNIAYLKPDKIGERTPEFLRQRKNETELIMDELGIDWNSYDWIQPGVFPVYLDIRNPIDADKPFPQDLLNALKEKARYKRNRSVEDGYYNTTWTKDYPLKQWIKDIEQGFEGWSTQIPKDALPILEKFGYDGIKERGLKGSDKPREERGINWIAFKEEQIYNAIREDINVKPESYQRALKTFKEKTQGRMNMTFGLDTLPELYTIGKYHISKGLNNFADWSKQMVKELGDKVRPYLKRIWDTINQTETKARFEEKGIRLRTSGISADMLKRKNESLSEYRQRIEKLRGKETKTEIKAVEKPKEETPRRISTTSYTQAETKFLDKLENVKNKPLSERMKIATQENLNKVKDFPFKSKVGNVFNAAKNKGKALWVGYKSPPRATDINISVREWTGAKNEISKVVMDMQESIKKKVPDRDTRRGMKAYIEANGNMELLKKWESEALLDVNKRKYKQAQNLSTDEIKIANDVKQWYDDKLKMAQDYEVIEEGVENYVNRKWKKKNTVTEGVKNDFVYNPILKTNFESARKRVFETEFEGEQLKYETLSDDLVDNIGWYSQGLDNVINNRNYIKNLTYGKASDGRPLVAPTGFGKTIEGKTNEIGFINPDIKTGNTSDYISLNHPALKQWKWATTVDGNPVFAKVDLAVHPEIYKKLRNNLGESAMRDIPVYKQLRDVQKQIKGLIFTLSPFHIVQEGTHAVGHEINPFSKKLPEFDPKNKQHRKAVNSGLQLYDYNAMESMSEGLSVTNLGRKFPGAAYLQDLTFKTVIPKLKLATWEKMYEHNTKIYGNKYSDAEISMLTSDQVNAAYGHLNYKAMFRNPTIQDIFRFTTLAPDFLEARTRFLGQALRPTGVRQLKALGILAGTMYISARVLNQVINGDMYLDDPRMIFAVKIDDRVYDMRSVPGDLWELIEDPRRFLANRLSPMIKGIIESLTQKDYAGRPVDFSETVKDLAMTFIPSIIKGRLDMTFAQNLLSNFGFRNKKYRTPIEAEINKEYWQYNPPGKRTDSSKEKSEVLNEVRKLKLNGQLEEAEKLYTESQDKGLLGKKDYDDFLKDLDKGEYVNKFKQLPAEVQRELITDMEQPEIEKYFEGMKLEVRKDFYDTMPEGVKTLYYPDTFRKKSEKIIEKQSESYKYMDAMSKTNEGEKPKEVRRPKSTKPKSKKPYEKKY